MKIKYAFGAFALALAVVAGVGESVLAAAKSLKGEKYEYVDTEWSVGEFTGISVSTGVNVIYSTGPQQSVSAKVRKDLEKYLHVKVTDDRLSIYFDGAAMHEDGSFRLNAREAATVTVVSPVLDDLDVNTGSKFEAEGKIDCGKVLNVNVTTGSAVNLGTLTVTDLDLEVNTGSLFSADKIEADEADIDCSNGSRAAIDTLICTMADVDVSTGSQTSIGGKADRLKLDVSSGAQLLADGFKVRKASGDVSIGSSASLSAETSAVEADRTSAVHNVR